MRLEKIENLAFMNDVYYRFHTLPDNIFGYYQNGVIRCYMYNDRRVQDYYTYYKNKRFFV